MRYKEGENRDTEVLFPLRMDEYISDNNPVRFIEAFVGMLDLAKLNFVHSVPKRTGRKAYNPADLLKLYIYGYMNDVRSSRKLEKLTYQNIEVMWLLKKLNPDFKTIADFRKDNHEALVQIQKEFILFCRGLNIFGNKLVAIDGSKFRAQNSLSKNLSKNQVLKYLERADSQIREYLNQLNETDSHEIASKELSKEELESKIQLSKEEYSRYKAMLEEMESSGDNQISLSDPDSRKMPSRQGTNVSYNVQIGVEDKTKMIIASDVVNDGNDLNQLYTMSKVAKEALGVDSLDVVADTGYFNSNDIKRAYDEDINCYVAEPDHGRKRSELGLFTKTDFIYDKENNCYICPAGEVLSHSSTVFSDKKWNYFYRTKACKACKLRDKCTTSGNGRRISRWVHQDILEDLNADVEYKKELIARRKGIVEHPFGTFKRNMNYGHFLCRGLEKVRAEFSLTVLTYNIKRLLKIMDFDALMRKIRFIFVIFWLLVTFERLHRVHFKAILIRI